MGTFNYKRFNREIAFPKNGAAISYLVKELNRNTVSFADFWQSAERDSKITTPLFLEYYFMSKTVSVEILRYFYDNENMQLACSIKEHKVFNRPHHLNLINEVFNNEAAFLKELSFWKDCFDNSERILEEINTSFLSKYDFEQVLLLCGFYYDKMRIAYSIHRNTDSNLIQVISEILNYKLRKIRKLNVELVSKYDAYRFLVLGHFLLHKMDNFEDNEIKNLFGVFETHLQLNELYDRYCYQDFSIKFINDNTVNLTPKDKKKYLKYRNDGGKYPYWQNYHQNALATLHPEIIEDINTVDSSWYNKLGNINTEVNYYQYIQAGFPAEIAVGGNKVGARECLKVLNSLSMWTNIRWNDLIERTILAEQPVNPYDAIRNIIDSNAQQGNSVLSICDRLYDELVKITEETLAFKPGISRLCLKLLTNNLSDNNRKVNLMETPFIKYGTNVYWIAGIFSNKNYCLTLQNVLLKSDESIRTLVAKESEENLSHFFKLNSFQVILNYHYTDGRGEIDLLAFKDGYLFVCQVKSTYTRTTLKEITKYRNDGDRGINKAISQLEKDIAYLRLSWNQIRSVLGTTLNFDELTVVPLAVTTSLEEGEKKILISGYDSFIVSIFDLKLILCNQKRLLWNIPEMALMHEFSGNVPAKYMEVLAGVKNDEKISNEIALLAENFFVSNHDKLIGDLWKDGTGLCSPKDLVNALRDNLVWDFLRKTDRLLERKLTIDDCEIYFSE